MTRLARWAVVIAALAVSGFAIIWVSVQSSFAQIIPANETWSAKLLISDGDLTNNFSAAQVFRP